jgi:hypothetical protein
MEVKALHVLQKSTSGAHIAPSDEVIYTAIYADKSTLVVSKSEFDGLKEGRQVFKGQLQKGGGRHSFFGCDLNEATKLAQ